MTKSNILTNSEQVEFEERVAAIRKNLASATVVYENLREIREKNLHRSSGLSFGEWARREFNVSANYLWRLETAAETKASLPNGQSRNGVVDVASLNERQLRELRSVEPERRAEVLERANHVAEESNRRLSASLIAEVREEEPANRSLYADADAWFVGLDHMLRKFVARLNEGVEEPQGAYLDRFRVSVAVSTLRECISHARPHTECGECGGAGCADCRHAGFLARGKTA